MPSGEISTDDIVKQALVQGKKIFVPYIRKPSESSISHTYMEMFALHSQDDVETLQRDAWGIPTLSKATLQDRENALGGFGPSRGDGLGDNDLVEGLDLILLPGIAFDHQGGRLGHGKGFYDHFLQTYWERISRKDALPKMPYLGRMVT